MPGPCPGGAPTLELHAKCQDRANCTGPGCRVRRAKRTVVIEHPVTGELVEVPA